ncbi:MAG: bacterioferritin [Venatoribacter sp.]
MQGNTQVIEKLNELLAGELAGIDQYFIHSQMYQDWGFTKLFERISHEAEDEKGHAAKLIERILFLGGTPNMEKRTPLAVGKDVPSMLKNDLELEYQIIKNLRDVMAFCESVQDYQSRDMLQILLDDSENDHAHWLEQQLGLIDRLGLANYLQAQL